MAGLVIVPPGGALGVRVEVDELSYRARHASFASVPAFSLRGNAGTPGRAKPLLDCDPFEGRRSIFGDQLR